MASEQDVVLRVLWAHWHQHGEGLTLHELINRTGIGSPGKIVDALHELQRRGLVHRGQCVWGKSRRWAPGMGGTQGEG